MDQVLLVQGEEASGNHVQSILAKTFVQALPHCETNPVKRATIHVLEDYKQVVLPVVDCFGAHHVVTLDGQ